MARRTSWRVCSQPGCPQYTDQGGQCPDHRREAEHRRGSARQRGYGGEHETRFRPAVLAKHPTCVLCGTEPSKHADHWPIDRKELVARGLDPNDPKRGRGLCQRCHAKETASNPDQQGGWARQD